jgi:hypothetical protein
VDVEQNLKILYPTIFEFLGDRRIGWKKTSQNYERLIKTRKHLVTNSKTGIIQSELCLLDIIAQRVINKSKNIHLSEFFNTILQNLLNQTDEAERIQLSNTIYNTLINLDRRYLNFVGELAVLSIMKDQGYYLEQTEFPLTKEKNTKRIDFLLSKEGENRLLEVVNIHIPFEIPITKESVKLIFESKVKDKIAVKNRNTEWKFSLAPVIWSDFKTLEIINGFFEPEKYDRVLFPFAYMGYNLKGSNQSKVMFGSIDRVIEA